MNVVQVWMGIMLQRYVSKLLVMSEMTVRVKGQALRGEIYFIAANLSAMQLSIVTNGPFKWQTWNLVVRGR